MIRWPSCSGPFVMWATLTWGDQSARLPASGPDVAAGLGRRGWLRGVHPGEVLEPNPQRRAITSGAYWQSLQAAPRRRAPVSQTPALCQPRQGPYAGQARYEATFDPRCGAICDTRWGEIPSNEATSRADSLHTPT